MSLLLTCLFLIYTTFTIVLGLGQQHNLPVNSSCLLSNGDIGVCKRVDLCASAKRVILNHKRPIVCSFEEISPFIPIVCCVPENDLPFHSALASFTFNTTTTTPSLSESNTSSENNTQTRSQTSDATIRIGGEKKCKEYNDFDYKYPTNLPVTSTTQVPYQEVLINPHKFITGGIDALPLEFPHVALLGYGDPNDIHWLSGGGLISENFILTAAHCLSADLYGPVKYVRLGDLDIRSNDDDAFPVEYEVAETYEYPEYRPDSKYHDIGLIRLKKNVEFSTYIKPACIYVPKELPKNESFVAAGWGRVYFGGTHPNNLQKVELNITDFQTCSQTYTKGIDGLEDGVNVDTQICAEGADEGGDTCQGDSGTPLQFFDPELYQIVGITSFGINCGVAPAIYTRVSYYINWIEGIVWP
ncbi:venom protease-like [Onthophagus taurus]|uniref:venom protease-like n=1 Tax=Onthophagus taurus TaxID=166361 RepID=UPI0039BECBC3